MKWHRLFIVTVLAVSCATFTTPSIANAEYLDEAVNNVIIPGDILWYVQGQGGGYIIYSAKDLGDRYEVVIARDGEPHQFPYAIMQFTKEWEPIGTYRKVDPAKQKEIQVVPTPRLQPTPPKVPPQPIPAPQVKPPVAPQPQPVDNPLLPPAEPKPEKLKPQEPPVIPKPEEPEPEPEEEQEPTE